uniref:Ion_trans domain-containing protein n=1 Tax=Schistocephalus solidus TaxID=70667 RepID=A0A183S891_SCHSO
LSYLRILDYLLVFRPFGPHIIIMKPMLQEFSIFLVVIIIVLVPQAIALQRLSFPYLEKFSVTDFLRSLQYPYYNLYGEIERDGLSGTQEACEPNGINCPLTNPMLAVIQVFYLFFALVLLINILIAVFSEVFNRLSPKSLDHWQLDRLSKTQHYNRRSAIPKPYSIINYAYKIGVYCAARALNRNGPDKKPYGHLSRVVINEKRRIDFIETAVSKKVFRSEKAGATALATVEEINNL